MHHFGQLKLDIKPEWDVKSFQMLINYNKITIKISYNIKI
jgi:hypothetical protein